MRTILGGLVVQSTMASSISTTDDAFQQRAKGGLSFSVHPEVTHVWLGSNKMSVQVVIADEPKRRKGMKL